MPCPICSWRRRLIRFAAEDDQTEETDAPANECDCSFPPVLELLHTDPGPLWRRIIMTDTLKPPDRPQTRLGSHRLWVRIPLRIPEAERAVNMSDCHYVFEGRMCNPDVYVEAFHNARLQHLVGGPMRMAMALAYCLTEGCASGFWATTTTWGSTCTRTEGLKHSRTAEVNPREVGCN